MLFFTYKYVAKQINLILNDVATQMLIYVYFIHSTAGL